jgi:Tfp pilus assembly protein PilV
MRSHSVRATRRKAGMSLVETSISLVILSVGILGMIAAQVTALQQSNQGRHSTEAAQLARDQMEFVQRLPWTHSAVTVSAGWTAPRTSSLMVQRSGAQTALAEQSFDVSWRVSAGATPDLRRVDVRVQWTEDTKAGAAANRSYVMSALKVNE